MQLFITIRQHLTMTAQEGTVMIKETLHQCIITNFKAAHNFPESLSGNLNPYLYLL